MAYWRVKLIFCTLFMTFVLHVTAKNLDANEATDEETDRSKRQSLNGFTAHQKTVIVDLHNRYRREQHASNMERISWDTHLEAFAQNMADKCTFAHSTNAQRTNVAGFQYIGENLYASTASGPVTDGSFMTSLYDEIKSYNYNANSCQSGVECGHYTQIVWATSNRVGCGAKYCSHLNGVNWGAGYIVFCNYGPGGNYNNLRPYKTGAACSQCPSGHTNCVDGLCD